MNPREMGEYGRRRLQLYRVKITGWRRLFSEGYDAQLFLTRQSGILEAGGVTYGLIRLVSC
jgi:hypothetical protein